MKERTAWAVFWILFAAVSMSALTFDFRTRRALGNEPSLFMGALSMARDGDFRFDERELQYWREAGWTEEVHGLFYQRYRDAYAIAKPVLYPLLLGAGIRLLGVRAGVMTVNWMLFAALLLVSWRLLRLRFSGWQVPVLLIFSYLASYVYFWLFCVELDLMHALLVALACLAGLKFLRTPRPAPLLFFSALLALCATEKISMLLLLAPLWAWMLAAARGWRQRTLAVAVFAGALALCVWPYLHYSDGRSWNGYGGERYFSGERQPFTGDMAAQRNREAQDDPGAFRRVVRGMRDPGTFARNVYFYFFGAYTGVLVFSTLSGLLIFAAVGKLSRSRGAALAPLLLGLLLFLCGYLFFYADNYYGGGQCVGNRWFLKAVPFTLALAVESRLGAAAVARLCALALAGTVAFLPRHHAHHREVYANVRQEGVLQRYFPFEWTQSELARCVSPNRVNLSPFPHSPEWKLLRGDEPVPFRLLPDGTMAELPVVQRAAWRYAKVRPLPIYDCILRQPQAEIFADGIAMDTSQLYGCAWRGSVAVLARGKGRVPLRIFSEQPAQAVTADAGGHTVAVKAPALLLLDVQPGAWRKVILTSGSGGFFIGREKPGAGEPATEL